MTSRQQFSPLCDLHHVSMKRAMLEEDSEEVRSCHACERRGCTRVFCDCSGYSDRINGQFDNSRALMLSCPACGAVLFLADVDGRRKVETWECPRSECDFSQDSPSPSAR